MPDHKHRLHPDVDQPIFVPFHHLHLPEPLQKLPDEAQFR
jgi:hypothetical protein